MKIAFLNLMSHLYDSLIGFILTVHDQHVAKKFSAVKLGQDERLISSSIWVNPVEHTGIWSWTSRLCKTLYQEALLKLLGYIDGLNCMTHVCIWKENSQLHDQRLYSKGKITRHFFFYWHREIYVHAAENVIFYTNIIIKTISLN